MLREMVDNEEDVTKAVTTKVTNMSYLFMRPITVPVSTFNQDISGWDVSNVTNMFEMFLAASSFNQPLNDWDVSNVTNMYGMFSETTSFNQDLSNWSVGNVTECGFFSRNTPQWTLPQPNFTNCNPD